MIELAYRKGAISEKGIIDVTVALKNVEKAKFEEVLAKLQNFVKELNGQTTLAP